MWAHGVAALSLNMIFKTRNYHATLVRLLLRQDQPSKPSVYPLVSCCGAESSTNVDIGCLATGYLPEPVTVAWDQNGSITSGIRTFPAVRHKGSSHYSLSSVLSVSSADWKTKTYKCLVKHEPTNTNTDKTVSSAVCKTATSKPAVQVLQSSCDDLDGNGSIELICLVSGYSPDKIKVQWLRNGETTFLPAYTSPSIKGREGTFSTTSQVNISKSDWILGERYTCKVDHPATNTSLHDSIRNCPESPSGVQLKVSMIPPKAKDLYVTKQPSIVCQVTKMESADGLSITWKQEDGSPLVGLPHETEVLPDGTLGADSTLTITTDAWKQGSAFSCKVEHPDLSSPVTRTIRKPKEREIGPSMYLFPPHQHELDQHELVSLTCLVKGFSPPDIYVQWKHRNTVLPDNSSRNTALVLESGTNGPDTYFMYSLLTISKSNWENRDTYSCTAFHSALPKNQMQRSIQKAREIYMYMEGPPDEEEEGDFDNLWNTAATFIALFLLSVLYGATITLVKVKWFLARLLQYEQEAEFITVLDPVAS